MATKKVYDECCRAMCRMKLERITKDGGTPLTKPDMLLLFGRKKLVSEKQFMACSKSEQRRHLRQDDILRSLYIELEAAAKRSIKRTNMVASKPNTH